jgi:hypothetical protein
MKTRSQLWTPVALGLVIFVGACARDDTPQEPLPVAVVPFERKGEPPTFATICRYEFSDRVKPFAIFELTQSEGVQTCFSNGKGRAFVPLRRDRCPTVLGLEGTQTNRAAAEDEFFRCSAAYQPSSRSETDVVLYRPHPTYEGDADFLQFGLDVGALVTADMLPATHLAFAGDAVCLEGPNGREIVQHIAQADIALQEGLSVLVERGTCREIGLRLLGRSWPEISPKL